MPDLQTDALRYEVRRKPVGGAYAVDSTLEVIRVFESAGGGQLDHAELEVDLSKVATRYSGWTSPPYLGDEIEIERTPTSSVVHWGKIVEVDPYLGRSGERIRLISRLEPYHAGGRVDGMWHYDPIAGTEVLLDRDVVFNPVVDGTVQGNRHITELGWGSTAGLFLDPDAVRTAASQTLYGAAAGLWTLGRAIHYLLWSLNSSETYITNPSLAEILLAVDDATAEFSGVQLARGLFLSEALDQVLGPWGYRWRISRTAGSREFKFFRRGFSGTIVTVKHQAAGAALDLVDSSAAEVNVKFDVAPTVNQITACGDFAQYELTAELLRAWPESQDSLADGDAAELARSHENFDDHPDAYRKWVLNEAGDYIGLRPEITGVFPTATRTALSSAGILTDLYPPRRRGLLPTLTLGADGITPIGQVRGVEVEYSNYLYGQPGEPEWLPLSDTACEILEHEAGIYLSGERLPEMMLSQGTSLKVRVTFTLETDYRLRAVASRQSSSPHPDVVPAVLTVGDRFHARIVTSLSKYEADVHADPPTRESLEQNDSAAIQTWANKARETWDLLSVAGRVTLDGLDAHSYQVGQRVSEITGRSVSFSAHTGTTAYPQIVAIERDVEGQQTVLHLERFTPAGRLGGNPRGGRR